MASPSHNTQYTTVIPSDTIIKHLMHCLSTINYHTKQCAICQWPYHKINTWYQHEKGDICGACYQFDRKKEINPEAIIEDLRDILSVFHYLTNQCSLCHWVDEDDKEWYRCSECNDMVCGGCCTLEGETAVCRFCTI